ncbi:thaumatin [Mycena sanguinolenta]|nr:thaumatin [Mycena sanguinolenta]
MAMASTAAAQRTMTVHGACPFTICFSPPPAQFPRKRLGMHTSYHITPHRWVANANTTVSFQVAEDWRIVCDVNTGTGVPPSTLAEFNFNGGGNDWYDVSLVDGFNLPMRIDNNVGCEAPSCPVDLGPNCACMVTRTMIEPNFGVQAPPLCKARSTPPTSPSAARDNCPDAYAYAYDESSGTALWSCTSSLNAAYTITFCP